MSDPHTMPDFPSIAIGCRQCDAFWREVSELRRRISELENELAVVKMVESEGNVTFRPDSHEA